MDNIVIWITENKEWVFSGIGVFAISCIVAALLKCFFHKKQKPAMKQINKNHATGIQIGTQNNYNTKCREHENNV